MLIDSKVMLYKERISPFTRLPICHIFVIACGRQVAI